MAILKDLITHPWELQRQWTLLRWRLRQSTMGEVSRGQQLRAPHQGWLCFLSPSRLLAGRWLRRLTWLFGVLTHPLRPAGFRLQKENIEEWEDWMTWLEAVTARRDGEMWDSLIYIIWWKWHTAPFHFPGCLKKSLFDTFLTGLARTARISDARCIIIQ